MAREPPPGRRDLLAVYAILEGPRTWRSLKLAVDTGATYTMVPPDLLLDIGYDPTKTTRQLELSTVSGLVMAPLVHIRAVKCLGCTVKAVDVVAHHLPPESPVEGLLGLNVLAQVTSFNAFCEDLKPFLA